MAGVLIGAGPAQAEVEEGHYVIEYLGYGVIPGPESNVTVIGNQFQQDFFGFGPQNVNPYTIVSTPDGGIGALGADPVSQWMARVELHKTPTGYSGTTYELGLPIGSIVMTKTPRLANQPR